MAYRVFISCVTNEFGSVREVLAEDLAGIDILAVKQETFRPDADGDTVLRNLRKKIRNCDAVICIHGAQSGWFPPDSTVRTSYRRLLPPNVNRLSATQWEYYFAKDCRKRTFVCRPSPQMVAEAHPPAAADDPAAQQKFNDLLEHEHGHTLLPAPDLPKLRVKVQQIEWQKIGDERVVSMGWRIAALLIVALFANIVSAASNGGTVLDLAPIFFLGPSSKPAVRYYVAGYKGHGLFVAIPSKLAVGTLNITGQQPVSLSKISPFDVWTMPNPADNHVAIKLALGSDTTTKISNSWTIKFGPGGGPCISISDLDTQDCYPLTRSIDNEGAWGPIPNWTGPPDADFGRVTLSSRYDDLVARGNMIGVLGGAGFSILIAVILGDLIRLFRSFKGAVGWELDHAGRV